MEWEILGAADAVRGPVAEATVVTEIRSGALLATTKARPVGKEAWRPVGAHEPFAEALAGRARDLDAKVPKGLARVREGVLDALAVVLLVMLCLVVWFAMDGHIIFSREGHGIVLSLP